MKRRRLSRKKAPGAQNILYIILIMFAFLFLTILTQIGGVILLISITLSRLRKKRFVGDALLFFVIIYGLFTFLIVPLVAPIFGRQALENEKHLQPASYFTMVCNRNYVIPELNNALHQAANELESRNIPLTIYYLDANFPFINGFPLLPHLSHNDGKKIDLSFVYEDTTGTLSHKQKSNSGYGIFEPPLSTEIDQTTRCKQAGYWQYDYSKYLTFGIKNDALRFSKSGTKELISILLNQDHWGKIFIEPHLKQRMELTDSRVRFHGCGAVRHDDHIHIQLK